MAFNLVVYLWAHMGKPDFRRIADCTFGTIGLIVFGMPILAMLALSYAESGQSGLYCQKRYGLRGKAFTIYKIRTLDKEGNLLPISGLLRRFGADELIQCINIILGDMSIIGPRPHDVIPDIPNWDKMFQVRPGLVGLNSVVEKRHNVVHDFDRRARIEAEYVDNRQSVGTALGMDACILWTTCKLVVAGKVDIAKHPPYRFPIVKRERPDHHALT